MITLSSRFLLAAVACALLGMAMGIGMGMSEDFTLMPAHAHLNLLGWVSLALYGLFYRAEPAAGAGRLARAQFWLATAGVALMVPGIAWRVLGHVEGEALIVPGSLLVFAAMAMFGAVVLRHRRAAA